MEAVTVDVVEIAKEMEVEPEDVNCSQMALVVTTILTNAGDEGDARDRSSTPGSGGSPGVGNGNPRVFLSGEVHGQRSLKGCSPGSHKESDTPE